MLLPIQKTCPFRVAKWEENDNPNGKYPHESIQCRWDCALLRIAVWTDKERYYCGLGSKDDLLPVDNL